LRIPWHGRRLCAVNMPDDDIEWAADHDEAQGVWVAVLRHPHPPIALYLC
jgi:hypothetical protein